MSDRALVMAAALSCALAIAAGAFGAHGAASPEAAEWLRTGAMYQLVNGVAAVALAERHPRCARVLLAGAMLFAMTLYAMALGAPRWLGAVTPVGGALMIAGWLGVAWQAYRRPPAPRP